MQKYGQHFLINEKIITQIIDAVILSKSEQLVEIGPGKGALTLPLIQRGVKNFTVVEIDPDMVAYLQKVLPSQAGVKILQSDFLKTDLAVLLPQPTLFLSNLPYIDAAAILDKVLDWPYFQTAVFMFQKEQAQRIRARAGETFYGPLSIFSQLCAQISLVCKVSRGCFNPPPKVESMVLVFRKCAAGALFPTDWPHFKGLINAAFLHRRKTLFNSLVLGGYQKEKVQFSLAKLHLAPAVRAEQISPETYVQLARLL